MNPKPLSPLAHGFIDYAFSAGLFLIPAILKIDKKAKQLFALNALNVALYSSFSKYTAGAVIIIPLQLHKKLDCGSLALIALERFATNQLKKISGQLYLVQA